MTTLLITIYLTTHLFLAQLYPYYVYDTETKYVISDGACKGLESRECERKLQKDQEHKLWDTIQDQPSCEAVGNEWVEPPRYFSSDFNDKRVSCAPYYTPRCSVKYVGKMPEVDECRWVLSRTGRARERRLRAEAQRKKHQELNERVRSKANTYG